MPLYYKQTIDEVLSALDTGKSGLSSQEAKKRLRQYGPNAVKVRGEPLWRKLIEPFRSVFMLILFLAAGVSLSSGERLDAIIILVIIAISAGIYYVQRFSSERVLKALERHEKQQISTKRDGKSIELDSKKLVPGDIIRLHEGEKVPADARIIDADNIRANESMLTGESVPVSKIADQLDNDKQVYERNNMLFSGAYVVSGSVTAIVTATGNDTQFGQIAGLAGKRDLSSPIQQKIAKLVSQIVAVVAVLAMVVFALGFYRGLETAEALRLVITLSIAAIPEGLPVAISVVLVLGMRSMAKRHALVRSMRSIENLGIVTTVATDKTGTLTKNQLSVQDVWTPHIPADLRHNVTWAYLSVNQNEGGELHDPMDQALMDYADEHPVGIDKDCELADSLPFDQHFSMSGNVWKTEDGYNIFLKGAPEKILELCEPSQELRDKVMEELHHMTEQGYRVIALARLMKQPELTTDMEELNGFKFELLNLMAIADELREESSEAIALTESAGIKVRMITGDHSETAYSIGKELGLVESRDQVFDCSEMEGMSDADIAAQVANIKVFSRVLPEYKHRILGILKREDITAMTGDGVNDVPALTNAHIGFAMGSGSQIAKDSGDIVLLDDNFSSITAALEQGRVIFDNIRRMLYYLLSTNLGEVLTTVVALLAGMPLPILPLQILWINLGTDTALVIPLGLEPAENDVMRRKPRSPKKPIIGRVIISRMVLVGVTMMVATLACFYYFLQVESLAYARSIAFNVLVVVQFANAFNSRSEWQSMFSRLRVFNLKFYVGLAVAALMHLLAMRGPLREILHLEYVATSDIVLTGAIGVIAVVLVAEIHKLVGRRYYKRR